MTRRRRGALRECDASTQRRFNRSSQHRACWAEQPEFVEGLCALGSRLARRHDPARLLAVALAVTAVGFAILWPSTAPVPALAGLTLLGLGLGNLFPMGLSVTVSLAPERAALASARAVAVTSFAVLLAPLTVGALADATSLTAALGVVPVVLALAAAALTLVTRASRSPARV